MDGLDVLRTVVVAREALQSLSQQCFLESFNIKYWQDFRVRKELSRLERLPDHSNKYF